MTLVADCTQLRPWCDTTAIRLDGDISGVFALYSDLSHPAIAFYAADDMSLQMLFSEYSTQLEDSDFICICTQKQVEMLAKVCTIIEQIEECQMVLKDTSRLQTYSINETIRLGMEHSSKLRELWRMTDNPAWTASALNLGPYRGIVDSDGTILSVAGVHYVTPYAAEIGNVATHPQGRRKGYASSCVAAVARDLTEITDLVVLHFFESNKAAKKMYEKLGFEYTDINPLYFVKARL